MTIYIDIVLLENLCMNYAILFSTALVTKSQIKITRLLLSSLIGGIYAVISFMELLPIYSNFLLKIILSIIMVYICFSAKNMKLLLKQLTVFYLVSFVFGGTAFALLYFISPKNISSKNGLLVGTYPIKIALLGAMVGFVLLQIVFRVIKTKISRKDMFCSIEINIFGKTKEIKAMIDTGNLLKEPITGNPVIVVEAEELKEMLPETVLDHIDNIIDGKIENIENIYDFKFRMIPFTSLGKQNGLLLGMKLDEITIKKGEELLKSNDVIMGIYQNELSKSGLYNALIGLDMLERSTNEFIRNVKV